MLYNICPGTFIVDKQVIFKWRNILLRRVIGHADEAPY
jgi:hypothetical protein